MPDNKSLDEMRQRIQESLIQAKRERLRDEFGMLAEYKNSKLPSEVEIAWLDNVLNFEQQIENAKIITVRQRIGNPSLKPLNEIPLHALGHAVDDLLHLLSENGVGVDFLGEFDDVAAYCYLTEELLDEEIDDLSGGWRAVFTPSTPEYDVQMWVEHFVMDLFTQERDYFLSSFDKQPLFDMDGEAMTAVQFRQQIESFWKRLPPTNHISIKPITVQVAGEDGRVTAIVSWQNDKQGNVGEVESFFRLQPSPYTGWDVVQTSLLADLLAVI